MRHPLSDEAAYRHRLRRSRPGGPVSDHEDQTLPGAHTLIHPNPVASLAPSLMSPVRGVRPQNGDPITLDFAGNLGVKTDAYMIEVFPADKISGAIGDRGVTGWPISGNMPDISGYPGATRIPHEYIRDVAYASDPLGRSDRKRDPSLSNSVSLNETVQVDSTYVGGPV